MTLIKSKQILSLIYYGHLLKRLRNGEYSASTQKTQKKKTWQNYHFNYNLYWNSKLRAKYNHYS